MNVDLIVFAGQSNMSGRGDARDAVVCDPGAGFEYKPISNPGSLSPIKEPFGLGEDKEGALDDFRGTVNRRTGSMVSAVVDEYYKRTNRQVIAVAASKGGSGTTVWLENLIDDAISRFRQTKQFLTANEMETRRIFVVWCQGESDGDAMMTANAYIENTKRIFQAFWELGAEKCFVVQIGHYNYLKFPDMEKGKTGIEWDKHYEVIRKAQVTLCEENEDFQLVGSFAPFLSDMKDKYHYNQSAYNAVGRAAGRAIAEYFTRDTDNL